MTEKQIDNRVAKLDKLDKEIKELSKQADALKKELQKELGEGELMKGNKWKVTWKRYAYPFFEKKKLPKELVEEYTTMVERRKFDWDLLKA